jgi:hypothetical protein
VLPARFRRALFEWLLVLAVLPLGAAAQEPASTPSRPICHFDTVRIDADFAGGAFAACERRAEGHYLLTVLPEDKPINPSPWYAFRVLTDRERDIVVTLRYPDFRHRYQPKTSRDGERWDLLPPERVSLSTEEDEASLRLVAGPRPLWVAAQEIIDNDDYFLWLARLDRRDFLQRSRLGKSAEGRDIHKLETLPARSRYLVVVGRQHPPEVTGAMALMAFMERVYADDPLATAFRAAYGVLLVPNLNPDGVARGYWRHSTGGIDLNRDWGPFTQPETRLMRDELERFRRSGGARLSLFLDFHSTNRDVFYTQFDDEPISMPEFTRDWMAALETRLRARYPQFRVDRKPGSNPESPTSKAWVYHSFGVPAITYELGDHTDRDFLRDYAVVSAEEMMRLLVEHAARK